MSALYHQFAAFTIGGLTTGALYALLAFGYTVVYRILGLFNFAHGGTFMVGTFLALFVARGLGVHAGQGALTVIGEIALMLGAAAGVGVILSMAFEYLMFKPIRARKGGGLPALVAGLGAITVLEEVFALWQGRDQVNVPQPISSKPLVTVFGGGIEPTELLVFMAMLVVLFGFHRYIGLGRMGRALRAAGQDAKTAALMGINVERVIAMAFAMAGATAGLAAVLFDLNYGNTSYFAGFDIGIKGLTAALLGGMGSVSGAVAGGLALGVAESYGGAILGAQWQDVIAFGALILVLVIRPTGIVGERAAMVRA